MMTNVDSEKSVKLEKQVLELWDRIYQSWMSADGDHGPKVTGAAVLTSWDAFISDLQKSPGKPNTIYIIRNASCNMGLYGVLVYSVLNYYMMSTIDLLVKVL